MTDKPPIDASKLSDDALQRIGDSLNAERARRGEQVGPQWAFMSPHDFELEKAKACAAGDRAKREAARRSAADKDKG